MTNLTLLELAVAVALDEGAERKVWAVHPAWSKREIEELMCRELVNTTKYLVGGMYYINKNLHVSANRGHRHVCPIEL
jgi:hypothetical protein